MSADLVSLVEAMGALGEGLRSGESGDRNDTDEAVEIGDVDEISDGLVDAANSMASHGNTNLIDALSAWLQFEEIAAAVLAETAYPTEGESAGPAQRW